MGVPVLTLFLPERMKPLAASMRVSALDSAGNMKILCTLLRRALKWLLWILKV